MIDMLLGALKSLYNIIILNAIMLFHISIIVAWKVFIALLYSIHFSNYCGLKLYEVKNIES